MALSKERRMARARAAAQKAVELSRVTGAPVSERTVRTANLSNGVTIYRPDSPRGSGIAANSLGALRRDGRA